MNAFINMLSHLRMWFFGVILIGFSIPASSLHAASIMDAEAGNLTPFSFEILWKFSESASPGVSVFSDAEGTLPLTGEVEVEFQPLHSGNREVSDNYAGRQQAEALRTAVTERQLVLVKLSGLAPDTTYWVRPAAVDSEGNDVTTGGPAPLIEVSTALANSFVEESRQLLFDFSASDSSLTEGAVLRVAVPDSDYPLFSVVGDSGQATEAFVNLDHLLEANGQTNLIPEAPLDLDIQLLGMGALEGIMRLTVPYAGGTVTAASTVVPFSPEATAPDRFIFDGIDSQLIGQAFPVTIRALDAGGEPLPSFTGTVEISSSLALSAGEGVTANFIGGVLDSHSVTVAETGMAILTATDTESEATGSSSLFNVVDQSFELSMNLIPSGSGTTTGAGVYPSGANVVIEATAEPGFIFDRWTGGGIADYGAASTTVSLSEDRIISAVFITETDINTYTDWKPGAFLRASGNAVLTALDYDFDGDGMINLLEYAFGTSPVFKDSLEVLPQIEYDEVDGAPMFSYYMRVGVTDLSVGIEYVTELGAAWQSYTPNPADVNVEDLGSNVQKIDVSLANLPEDAGFFRLVVTSIAP